MEDEYMKPGPLIFDNNLGNSWKKWIQKFNNYMVASGKDKLRDEKRKIALFLNYIGDDGLDVYNNMTFDDDGKAETLENVIEGFANYCIPMTNVTMDSYQFSTMKQSGSQNFDQHLTDLKKQASKCQFSCSNCKKSYAERMIRDHLVLNCPYKDLQNRLLQKPDLTLKVIENAYRSYELGERFKKDLHVNQDEVFAINRYTPPFNTNKKTPIQKSSSLLPCQYCSYRHTEEPGKCPATGKVCNFCQGLNHFAKCCEKRRSRTGYNEGRAIRPGSTSNKNQGQEMRKFSKEGTLSVM